MRDCETHSISSEPIHIDLSHEVPDYPQVNQNLDLKYYHVNTILDEEGVSGYCPALNTIPDSLKINAIWEGFETALVMQLLSKSGLFMDFGANIGWYSMIAATLGHHVLAVEADLVINEALQKNIDANGVRRRVTVANGFVGPDTEELDTDVGEPIRLLKSDVEGAEGDVLRVCLPLFTAGLIEYAIVELTPVFTSWDYVQSMLQQTLDCGYELRVMPDKGFDVVKFAADPLKATLEHDGTIDKHQVMGLLIRKDLL